MKKIIPILLCAFCVLSCGVATAYYNTSSLGYDDTRMFYADKGRIIVMDNEINLEKIKKDAEKLIKNTSDLSMPI